MGIQSKWKMPPILNHRKAKRATVLSKRIQYMRSYANRNKCYKPLYEKLRINNIYLARALSKKKQESQLLFSQNVALLAEVQDLGLACNKRNNVLIGILKNAKEMLRMLVTVTGYVTNTIASCQEFVSSFDNNAQVSHNLAGRKDSCRRLSIKSPAKGIVKPMVSGHTITKPTINLSRLNMQHIPKLANLSTIMEAAVTPNRNQENRQRRRMPERITIASPRPSDESERRLSNRSRHSGRMSGRYSRSNSGRFSGHRVTRHSTEHAEHVGSPRVELNDVSKLLRNSHTVNLRMLTQNESNCVNESIDCNNSMHNNSESNHLLKLPSTQISDDAIASEGESKTAAAQLNNNSNKQIDKGNGNVHDKSADFDDPLEGPSWLFNDSEETYPSNGTENKTDCDNNSNNTLNSSSRASKMYNVSDDMEKSEQISALSDLTKSIDRTQDFEMEDSLTSLNVGGVHNAELQREESNSLCAAPSDSVTSTIQSEYRDEEDATVNFTRFITKRRGPSPNINEDSDDFTLMFIRPPKENFDMNDLRLPVLEQSMIRTTVAIELEPEITTNVQRISENCPMPSLVNNGMNESLFDNSTIKLPIISNTDDVNREYASTRDEQLCLRKKQKRDTGESINAIQNILIDKKLVSQNKKSVNDKDPSTAKVVLEKLNDSRVCQNCTLFEAQHLRDSTELFSGKSLTSINDIENLSDSESSSASTSSRTAYNRPKRRKAPVNLREPKLNTKLRRKH